MLTINRRYFQLTIFETYFHNVLLDDLRIVAYRLNEEELEAHFTDNDVAYELASFDRGVGGVENGHFTIAALQPLANIVQSVLRALRPYRHGLYVIGTEKVVALIGRGGVSPVFSQIEDFRADADPVEVSAQFLGYVGLATSWQTDHRDHMRLVHEICTFTCKKKDEILKIVRNTHIIETQILTRILTE